MKKLSFTQADIESVIAEVKASLSNFKSNQDKFVYEKKFSEVTEAEKEKIKRPIIYFSMEAWLKMLMLVKNCDKEIAWQATVEKLKFQSKDHENDFYYYIKQVFVYPQKVTGTFVDVNEVKYAEWSLKLEDDIYNKLRFQGHSHVNMGVTPSVTDLNTYQNFLDQLDKDDYYIFMIMNKRQEFNIMVYDYAQDILFEHKDCFVDVLIPKGSLARWTEENMKLVEHKQEATVAATFWDEMYHNPTHQRTYSAPSAAKTELTQDEIGYANINGYLKNHQWHSFKNIDEAYAWFLENPEYIKKASLSLEHKTFLMNYLKHQDEQSSTAKKRGRPPKGAKK